MSRRLQGLSSIRKNELDHQEVLELMMWNLELENWRQKD